jgi:hypothetical protein
MVQYTAKRSIVSGFKRSVDAAALFVIGCRKLAFLTQLAPTLEEVESLLAQETGTAFEIEILKLNGERFSIVHSLLHCRC